MLQTSNAEACKNEQPMQCSFEPQIVTRVAGKSPPQKLPLTFHALVKVKVGFDAVVADPAVLEIVRLDLLTPVTSSYLCRNKCRNRSKQVRPCGRNSAAKKSCQSYLITNTVVLFTY